MHFLWYWRGKREHNRRKREAIFSSPRWKYFLFQLIVLYFVRSILSKITKPWHTVRQRRDRRYVILLFYFLFLISRTRLHIARSFFKSCSNEDTTDDLELVVSSDFGPLGRVANHHGIMEPDTEILRPVEDDTRTPDSRNTNQRLVESSER